MSHVRRPLGVALTILALGVGSATASAAPRVEVVDVPSLKGNVEIGPARVNKITKLQARVVLPDGYDAQPSRRWPLLVLLHGVGDDSSAWLDPAKGNLLARLDGLPAIVVLPEGGRGYFTDAWFGGARKGANWERYFFDEVLPLVQARYRVQPGREHHAIGGLSMGGYGAELLASQLPGYFGTALSFSGLHDIESPAAELLVPIFSGFSYTRQWGRYRGPYARAHNPIRLVQTNLRSTRVYTSVGNGVTASDVPFRIQSITIGAATEISALFDARAYVRRARAAGVDVTYRQHTAGVHYWWHWQRELQASIAWGLFGRPAEGPAPIADPARNFTYATMAPHGNAWGLGYRFSALPTDQMILRRSGQRLSATGKGTITIAPGAAEGDASGAGTRTDCAFTATLPFERDLPAGC